MDELISVIVPVYNAERYLDRCLKSIAEQTYLQLEIILIENASTDCSLQICNLWAAKDNRFRVISNDSSGLGEARNTGMRIASGERWMFVDADDYLPKNAVQILFERMNRDKSDIAIGKHLNVYEDGTTSDTMCGWMFDTVTSGSDVLCSEEWFNIPVSMWGKLYKRDVLKGICCPSLSCGEDLWVFPEIMNRCKKISLVENAVYYYYRHSNSIMNQKNEGRKEDEFRATLHMVQYVLREGYIDIALRWMNRAVLQGIFLAKRQAAHRILCESLVCSERGQLLARLSGKRRVEYCSFFLPGVFKVVQVGVMTIHRRRSSTK